MTLIRINEGQLPDNAALAAAAALPEGAPLIAMIHGFRFSPALPGTDPHRHILALDPELTSRRAMSWPRALGFGEACGDGLAIAFGWEARGSLHSAYLRADAAGQSLARSIETLAQRAGRPVAMIGHSLGARVALAALHHVTPGTISRAILLTAAEFRCAAASAMASPAGQQAEIINITSRENDLFDFGMELLVGRLRRRTLGFGLDQPLRNWIDVQIDDADTLDALAGLGFRMDSRAARLCHWSPYLRPGVFDFYRTALRQPWALPLGLLRGALPVRPAPRWSRLFALPSDVTGLLRA
ncbi:MAG: DUF726 domain-containing protein [Paracoccus sp. (in: a-proteobacteria)]|uniref:DUF726 domain-containing protein n=1 Tax=Paracoccus sp. TaxID=267 RepID=UPI0026E08853|nr:DUF726 domain-containing protein [Paracoccus sp. (in: a-proteobacteria)]MDO5612737.1 DUF726 domain-containing protein [Paracoccus sp. (in: a-proteobacteria)]